MGYQLPTRNANKIVELVRDGVKGLERGEIVRWESITKIEGDEDAVTFYVKEEDRGPFVVPIARDNELQVLNLRGIVENYYIGNDLVKYDAKTEAWPGMPEFDFSKLEDFERASQPASSGVGY